MNSTKTSTMRKYMAYIVCIFTIFGCTSIFKLKEQEQRQKEVEITGHFFKYVPYHLRFPKYSDTDFRIVEKKYFNILIENYDSLTNAFRFNIQEEQFSKLLLRDENNNIDFIIRPSSAKHPPIRVELKLNQYYKSGDTILIDFNYGGGLVASVINFDIDFRLTVKEFDLITIHNGALNNIHSEVPRLTPELINALKNRDKQTPIIFTNIIVKSINENVKVAPLVFFVRDE